MAYKKHTWGSGIPNRNKFEEMDNAIESVAPSNDGTNGQVLTKTSTGAKWQNASGGTAGDVTYDSSVTYPNGTVGKEITSLSEKIVNLYDVDTTQERVVGRYIYMDGDVKKSKLIYRQVFIKTSDITRETEFNIPSLESVLSISGSIDVTFDNLSLPILGGANGAQGGMDAAASINVMFVRNSRINISIHDNISNNLGPVTKLFCIVEYTKSSDTPTPV